MIWLTLGYAGAQPSTYRARCGRPHSPPAKLGSEKICQHRGWPNLLAWLNHKVWWGHHHHFPHYGKPLCWNVFTNLCLNVREYSLTGAWAEKKRGRAQLNQRSQSAGPNWDQTSLATKRQIKPVARFKHAFKAFHALLSTKFLNMNPLMHYQCRSQRGGGGGGNFKLVMIQSSLRFGLAASPPNLSIRQIWLLAARPNRLAWLNHD